MIRPAVDVVEDELATLSDDVYRVRSVAADVIAALWDAGYAVTPLGAKPTDPRSAVPPLLVIVDEVDGYPGGSS